MSIYSFLRLLHHFLQLFFAVPLKTAEIYKTVKFQGGGAHRTENITKKRIPANELKQYHWSSAAFSLWLTKSDC